MTRLRQNPEFEIVVDGEPYIWWLQRRPHWSSDPAERHGMALAVRHAEGQREAVIAFPLVSRPRLGAPQVTPAQIPQALVARAIGSAIEAGWEPLSRGKTVNIEVDAEGR